MRLSTTPAVFWNYSWCSTWYSTLIDKLPGTTYDSGTSFAGFELCCVCAVCPLLFCLCQTSELETLPSNPQLGRLFSIGFPLLIVLAFRTTKLHYQWPSLGTLHRLLLCLNGFPWPFLQSPKITRATVCSLPIITRDEPAWEP
jgi:hypothetical protein